MTKTAVIIVTHNSEDVLAPCLKSVGNQSKLPDRLCIVDSGSDDTSYLKNATEGLPVTVTSEKNIGFSRANNIGFAQLDETIDNVLFLNPDVILDPLFIEIAEEVLAGNTGTGAVTGRMAGFDFATSRETGRLDSTGIFRKWYGRWYDRGQGEKISGQYMEAENVPAACGALLFCRSLSLKEAALGPDIVFDPDFFLYKEDVELSLRLREAGWKVRYDPALIAFHGRGWQKNRRNMQRELRLMAARNEILLYTKHPSPYMVWAIIKYLLVTVFNI